MKKLIPIFLIFFFFACNPSGNIQVLTTNDGITQLLIDGPETDELHEKNPFLDYRLNVTFAKGERSIVVPGFYAADGNAGNSSAASGNKWKVLFDAPENGVWNYEISFRKKENIAVSDTKGRSGGKADKDVGSFEVKKDLGKGRLTYNESHYPIFRNSKEPFVKVGVDSPENLLAYDEVDATSNVKNFRKNFDVHLSHYAGGGDDLLWGKNLDKGKALMGAIEYLKSQGMNAISFLTLSADGDDRNVFPFVLSIPIKEYEELATDKKNKTALLKSFHTDRFDVSKLEQWERIFTFADRKEMFLHFKTLEVENESVLDYGSLGLLRKLYYRELVARFAHHKMLNWNLGEESKLGKPLLRETINYIQELDPYDNLVVLHTYPWMREFMYYPMLGDSSNLTGASIQTRERTYTEVHDAVKKWVAASDSAGRPWVVSVDEPGNAGHGLVPDDDDMEHDSARVNVLWGTYMAGGYGIEWYFGYKFPNSDLTCQDFTTRKEIWRQSNIARSFFENLPVQKMKCYDQLIAGDNYCFAQPGERYVCMIKTGGKAQLDLSESNGMFKLQWFDPKAGTYLPEIQETLSGGIVELEVPSTQKTKDWVATLTKM